VADSALERMVSAFRKITADDGRDALKSNTCGGRPIPLGVHFDCPRSDAVRKGRAASLDAAVAALWKEEPNTAADISSGQRVARALEIVLDGKRTGSDVDQDHSRNIFPEGAGGEGPFTVAAALPSSPWVPQQFDQQVAEGIVNSAKRVQEGPVGSPRERSAKEKLLARMAVLDARLQAKARLIKDGSATMGLPSVTGITDCKISAVVEKMGILGMIAPTNAGGQSEREAAQTRWMDNAKGRSFGGTWKGSIRYGASGDAASRDLASKLTIWKSGDKSNGDISDSDGKSDGETGARCLPCGKGGAWRSLVHWRPNPSSGDPINSIGYISDDADDEGRKDFGSCACAKACGHNETAMFYLRPFFPLEVINSRVCSLSSPAPGNSGFEGCLEYLRRMCAAAGRSLTYWDSECFALVDGRDIERCEMGLAPGECMGIELMASISWMEYKRHCP